MRKLIISIIVFISCVSTYSQQYPQIATDSIFMYLDKTEIKTGLLYNKVYPFSAIIKYNGVYDTVGNIANWKQMYS